MELKWVEYKDEKVWQLECGQTVLGDISRENVYVMWHNYLSDETYESDSVDQAKVELEESVKKAIADLIHAPAQPSEEEQR